MLTIELPQQVMDSWFYNYVTWYEFVPGSPFGVGCEMMAVLWTLMALGVCSTWLVA